MMIAFLRQWLTQTLTIVKGQSLAHAAELRAAIGVDLAHANAVPRSVLRIAAEAHHACLVSGARDVAAAAVLRIGQRVDAARPALRSPDRTRRRTNPRRADLRIHAGVAALSAVLRITGDVDAFSGARDRSL